MDRKPASRTPADPAAAGAKPVRLGVYERPAALSATGPLLVALAVAAVILVLLYLFFAESFSVERAAAARVGGLLPSAAGLAGA
jgi:hypothetical protein